MKLIECRTCNKIKPHDEKFFSSYRKDFDGNPVLRLDCRKCHSKKVANRRLEKLSKESPDDYYTCHGCSKIYSIKYCFCMQCGEATKGRDKWFIYT